MAGRLLERDDAVAAFRAAVDKAVAGAGSTVLVTGEAGIGKTTVIKECLAGVDGDVCVLAGGCDDLLAPRTLGPLRDAARGTGGALDRALSQGTPDEIFAGMAEELGRPPPTVLVIEDVHWADDATLDVLSFVVRRIGGWPAVLVLTFRADGPPAGNPIERMLAGVATVPTQRIALEPLTPEAVAQLAKGSGRPAETLHRITGGNPFFLSEVLSAPPDEVPSRVADLVLARVRHLSQPLQAALEQLSVVPTTVNLELAAALLDQPLERLADAEAVGLLEVRGTAVAFRHELARRAVADSLPRLRRRQANAAVVRALSAARPVDKARVVHHAVAAGDGETIARYAPEAAREAAKAGSHRQALTLLEAVQPYVGLLSAIDRARASFTRERGFWSHAYNLELHRCLLLLRRSQWVEAEAGLRALVEGVREPGMLYVYSVYNAHRFEAAVGAAREFLWYLARIGEPVPASVIGMLPGHVAGLDGDWRMAARIWREVGDRYEEALELAESGEAGPTLEALRLMDDLGASAAGTHVRARLRELGVTAIPRGPQARTRANPAGLTDRQRDVLALLVEGMTSAEIADRLVLSVRTVDNHVAPIVAAGRTEDKIEVNARVAHSGVGIDLRTQSPRPDQLRDAVRRILGEPNFRERARSVQREIDELGREEAAVAELEWLAATDLVSAEDCTFAA